MFFTVLKFYSSTTPTNDTNKPTTVTPWLPPPTPPPPLSSDRDVYFASLHFAIMTLTTVGYGDISPLTNAEFVLVAAYMVSN